jgi:hypothetical protein
MEPQCNLHSSAIAVLQSEVKEIKMQNVETQNILRAHAQVNLETAKSVAAIVERQASGEKDRGFQNNLTYLLLLAFLILGLGEKAFALLPKQ